MFIPITACIYCHIIKYVEILPKSSPSISLGRGSWNPWTENSLVEITAKPTKYKNGVNNPSPCKYTISQIRCYVQADHDITGHERNIQSNKRITDFTHVVNVDVHVYLTVYWHDIRVTKIDL